MTNENSPGSARWLFGMLAGVSLFLCLLVSLLLFLGVLGESAYRNLLLASSIGWFVFATLYQHKNTGSSREGQ